MMKRFLINFVLIVSVALFVSSCGDNDNENSTFNLKLKAYNPDSDMLFFLNLGEFDSFSQDKTYLLLINDVGFLSEEEQYQLDQVVIEDSEEDVIGNNFKFVVTSDVGSITLIIVIDGADHMGGGNTYVINAMDVSLTINEQHPEYSVDLVSE